MSPHLSPPDPTAGTSLLATPLLGGTLGEWIAAAAITLAILAVLLTLGRWAVRRAQRRSAARPRDLDELVVGLGRQTRWVLLLAPAMYLGALALELSLTGHEVLRTAALLAILLQVAIWSSVAIDLGVARYRRRRLAADAATATLLGSLRFVLKLVLWLLVVLLALENLGVNVTALVAGLGVGGIAVALALQNILGDILASLSIAIDKPFVLGDTIQIDDYVGSVESVGLKTTRLRSVSGEELVFANGDLLKSRIRNHRRMTERRVVWSFGVDAATPVDQLEKIPEMVRHALLGRDAVRFDRAHFKGFGKTSFEFEAVYHLLTPDLAAYMDCQQAALLDLLRALQAAGIQIAIYPPAPPVPPTPLDPPTPPSTAPSSAPIASQGAV